MTAQTFEAKVNLQPWHSHRVMYQQAPMMSDSQEYTGIPGVKARLFNPHSICLVFMVWLLTNQSRLYPQPDDLSGLVNFILVGIWKLDPFTQTQHINFCSLTKKSFKVIYIYIFFFTWLLVHVTERWGVAQLRLVFMAQCFAHVAGLKTIRLIKLS